MTLKYLYLLSHASKKRDGNILDELFQLNFSPKLIHKRFINGYLNVLADELMICDVGWGSRYMGKKKDKKRKSTGSL